MKKLFQVSLLMASTLVLTTSCLFEEENLFDQSAAERLNAASDKYTNILQSSNGGWVIEYYPTTELAEYTGTGYLWMTKFNKDMSVNVGMNNEFSDNEYREYTSLWRVITDNGPVLTFDSENPNVHAFSDPDVRYLPGSSTNVWGTGVGGDYEFVIVQAPTDDNPHVMLKGKKRGTYNRMTPLPAGTNLEEYLADVQQFHNNIFATSAPNYNIVNLSGVRYRLVNANSGLAEMYPFDGDAITETSLHPFLITKYNDTYRLRFRNNVSFDGVDAYEQEFIYDPAQDLFVGVETPENTVEGAVPAYFFNEYLEGSGTTMWRLDRNTSKSDAAKTIYDKAYDAFQTIKYTLESVAFANIDGKKALRVTCSYTETVNKRPVKKSVSYLYFIETSNEGDLVKVSFINCNEASEAVLSRFPDVDNLVKTLTNQTYTVSAKNSRFNLSSVTFTGSNDIWFDLSI